MMPASAGPRGRPAVFTVPPDIPFVDALARGLLAETEGDPLAGARVTVLLPTRRSCRALQEALLRAGEGVPRLLPRMVPLGDLDADELAQAGGDELDEHGVIDLPPAMAPLRRQLLLGQAILRAGAATAPDQAVRLGAELARFLDQVQTEGLGFDRLKDLVEANYARHWQQTLRFLAILTEVWPNILAVEGSIDPADRRNRILRARAEAWRRAPPADPVIAAGSTGSIPATAELLAVVARLPKGMVLLPGLDRTDAENWAAIREDPAHPQHGMALLLGKLGVEPDAVEDWTGGFESRATSRARLLSDAMRPARTCEDWRRPVDEAERERFQLALKDVTRIDCPGPQEEAGIIALLLREALQDEKTRAALVTPDRDLARRVAAELRRWDIRIDDSAGRPLAATPPGVFLRLAAAMVAERLAPVPLLAALKHPLAAGGSAPPVFRAMARKLERKALRGPRPESGFAGLRATLDDKALIAWLDRLADAAAPFEKLLTSRAPLQALAEAHIEFAERLAASDEDSGPSRLWAGEAGEAASSFMAELADAAVALPAIEGERYPDLLDSLMAGRAVRPRYVNHPRLAIWGPLEARLQRVDLMILAGLNEGTWPGEPAPDPWMSRPMRRDFGLPALERRIGLAAHDFAQGFMAREVVMTRGTRVEGTPSVPARWLLRLDALAAARGLTIERHRGGILLDWYQALDRPAGVRPIAAPAPSPPITARPTELSITDVALWAQDPYSIYAKRVLRLKALDPIDAEAGPAERGTAIHGALERFLTETTARPPADPYARLLAIGREEFHALGRPSVWAFWWPQFERIARWFVDHDALLRQDGRRGQAEVKGRLIIGRLTLAARADRIDRLTDGSLAIIDYKTGAVPTQKQIDAGYAPQLPLEAAMAAAGAFEGVARAPVSQLEYWHLTGRDPAGEPVKVKGDMADLAEKAMARLARLVAAFDDPRQPYLSRPRPKPLPPRSDFEHLARVKEWSTGAEET